MTGITDSPIQTESRDRYLTYALSVVSGRALPDVRDGLKPVQRRILYAMLHNLNLRPGGSHRKSAAVVGEVLARYHPHGDLACYEAMVRLAQDFSLRYPLVDGQGNFGSLDGDNAAAYRYTETRLRALALEVVGEINEDTVPFRDNFDATVQEPVVFPSRVPNLLMNGGSGIAVGMATSIPPHNLRDLVKAHVELLDNPDLSNSRLVTILKGPDFPTGCDILNTKAELDEMYSTGRGNVRMRGTWFVEGESRGKKQVVINSIPYAVNKSQLVERIANLIVERKVPQIVDIRDESTDNVRIVLEIAAGMDPEVAMAFLFKNTALESGYPVNMTVLVPVNDYASRPERLSLKQCLQHFIDFRQEVVHKRLSFERHKLIERIHILEGLARIYGSLDEVVKIVRRSEDRNDAAEKLKKRFELSKLQAFAVVDMHIYQLSKTNIEEVLAELKKKEKRVAEISKILKSKKAILDIVKTELNEIGDKYGDKRKCQLIKEDFELEYRAEDYVVQEEVYAIVTADGWIKRIRQNNELSSTRLREGDSILHAHPLTTLDVVVFITNYGLLYSLKVAEFPASSGYGNPIQKILKFKDGEHIVESYGVRATEETQAAMLSNGAQYLKDGDIVLLINNRGVGFAMKLDSLLQTRKTGKKLISLREGDTLASVCHLKKKIVMFSEQGFGLEIDHQEVPIRENPAIGVILIAIKPGDRLAGALSYEGKCRIVAELSSGKEKELSSADIVSGHRGLRGNKAISQAQIKSVKVASLQ